MTVNLSARVHNNVSFINATIMSCCCMTSSYHTRSRAGYWPGNVSLLVYLHNTQTMHCQIANPTNLETERPLTVTVHLGNQVQAVGTIRFREPLNLLVILIPAFSGVIILIVAIFIVTLVLMQRCQKRQHLTNFSAVQPLNQRWVSPMYTVLDLWHLVVSCPVCMHLPVKSSLVKEVKHVSKKW